MVGDMRGEAAQKPRRDASEVLKLQAKATELKFTRLEGGFCVVENR